MDGDPPAAMRYTEGAFVWEVLEALQDIEKFPLLGVDVPREEPTVLPTDLSNLLG